MRYYGVNEERIYIVPFLPPLHIISDKVNVDIKAKYSVDGQFIYYPAQFWPHKNHVYVLNAIKILKDEGIYLNVVFSGSDKGNLNHVMSYAKTLGIEKQLKYIGFVSGEDVRALYKEALALVMPTYFGPTNLPPLEAFALETPVIYSDTPDFRAQIGDAGLFCDLYNVKSLVHHLKLPIYNKDLRETLASKGKLKFQQILSNKFEDTLESIFDLYSIKLSTWKNIPSL
ncbi:MAG: glycosyltransferase [Candidatus Aenigmarchaeota archaeon]|nr:glycosyltransferase [Candidatus Aenigmarchaeota archaeon]MDW8160395.1 glycosyltransferase [Candidatus Aenigmarchaeota archaeon]